MSTEQSIAPAPGGPEVMIPAPAPDKVAVRVEPTPGQLVPAAAAAADSEAIAERQPVATGGVLILVTVAMALSAWFLPSGTNWLVVLVLIAGLFLLLGKLITGRAFGILINERNLMSLSRLQLVIWTALIVSGFFVIAIERIRSGQVTQPLSIAVDWQIWALLGMSTTSFVGTPLLYGSKRSKSPKDDSNVVAKAAARFDEPVQQVEQNRQGILYANASIQFARFTDMFQGDELSNAQLVDVSKLQLFFFTVIVAIAYGMQLYQLIAYGDLDLPGIRLPQLQDGLLALMGVSHAGYLGSKSVDHTPTDNS